MYIYIHIFSVDDYYEKSTILSSFPMESHGCTGGYPLYPFKVRNYHHLGSGNPVKITNLLTG